MPRVYDVEDCCVAGAVEEVAVDMVLRPKDVKLLWNDSPAVVEATTAPAPAQVT
jgi:hypothetical protein